MLPFPFCFLIFIGTVTSLCAEPRRAVLPPATVAALKVRRHFQRRAPGYAICLEPGYALDLDLPARGNAFSALPRMDKLPIGIKSLRRFGQAAKVGDDLVVRHCLRELS